MSTEKDTRTRELAYSIWERQGRPQGRHFEHWLQAERELAASEAKQAQPGAKAAKAPAAKKPRAKAVARRSAGTKKGKRSPSPRPGSTSP